MTRHISNKTYKRDYISADGHIIKKTYQQSHISPTADITGRTYNQSLIWVFGFPVSGTAYSRPPMAWGATFGELRFLLRRRSLCIYNNYASCVCYAAITKLTNNYYIIIISEL